MTKDFVSFSKPFLDKLESQYILECFQDGWISTGPRANRFASAFDIYLNTVSISSIPVSSCTAALHLALVAWELHGAANVVTSPLTFCATAEVVEYVGRRLVLGDIDRETGNISAEQLEKTSSGQTRVILPVHYAGLPCDMPRILEIASSVGAKVLEDAALAIGTSLNGKKIGTFGDATAFSFYATKNLTTAEGGMLCSNDQEFIEKCRKLSLHGMSRDAWKRYQRGGSWKYDVEMLGYKYNMPDILAALGIAQLEKLDSMNEKRRGIADRYTAAFRQTNFLEPFHWDIPKNIVHSRHLYPIVLRLEALKIDRDHFIEQMTERGIGTSVHYIPIHYHSYYRKKYGWKKGDFPNAEWLFDRLISLPIYPGLADEEVDRVIEAVVDIGTKFTR